MTLLEFQIEYNNLLILKENFHFLCPIFSLCFALQGLLLTKSLSPRKQHKQTNIIINRLYLGFGF